jgi:twinfilin
MLFASTRLTLVRELGSEHFRETLFATTPEELSAKGFEKHDKHTAMDAPLTEEERSLGEVKRAEMEAGSGTGVREIHLSKSLAMPVTEEAIAAMKEVGEDGGRALAMLVSRKSSNRTQDLCAGKTNSVSRKSTLTPKSSS